MAIAGQGSFIPIMGTTLDLVADLIRVDKSGSHVVEPTYSAGLSDWLGDRLICFADPGAASLELLRFKPEVGDAPGFEAALRASVEAVGRLDPSLSTVRAVERIEELGGLTLVSVREAGRRLSELMPRAGGPAHAFELIREIGPALALLHRAGHAHGALTPERIIVTREGHLIVLEHVLGGAMDALRLTGERLRSRVGIAVPDGEGPAAIDPRLDVIQLGFIALSLATSQRLPPADYPGRAVALLNRFSRDNPDAAADLRPWLERALQIGDRPFENAADALLAFKLLPEPSTTAGAGHVTTAWPQPQDTEPVITTHSVHQADEEPRRNEYPKPAPDSTASPTFFEGAGWQWLTGTATNLRRSVAVLGGIVVVQALVIGYLVVGRPAGAASVETPQVFGTGATPIDASSLPETEPAADDPAASSAASPPAQETTASGLRPAEVQTPTPQPPTVSPAPPEPPAPLPPEPGGLTFDSPVELQVFEGGTLIGSTSGPLSLGPGSHTLDLVSEELGFRLPQTVEVVSRQTTTVEIVVPAGRIDINAVPWADVWIDGVASGQTPLANLSLPIGRHEIVFRHPELGERRESVLVKVDGIARVSVVFQR